MPRCLGKVQLDILEALEKHGLWYRGCGWLWDTYSGTQRVLESLVKRGLVSKKMEERRPVYRLARAGERNVERREAGRVPQPEAV